MIRCPDPLPVMKELPMWVAVLVNGEDIGARIRVEQVIPSEAENRSLQIVLRAMIMRLSKRV